MHSRSGRWMTGCGKRCVLAMFMLNRKEVMNHAHLFAAVVSVLVQIPVFLPPSLSYCLTVSHINKRTLSRNHRGSEQTWNLSALSFFSPFILIWWLSLSRVKSPRRNVMPRLWWHKRRCVYVWAIASAHLQQIRADTLHLHSPMCSFFFYHEYNRIFVWFPSRFMWPQAGLAHVSIT